MDLLPFLISFYLGYLFIDQFLRNQREWTDLDVFLVPGIGLGLSSQIVFFCLLFFHHNSPIAVLIIHLILISFLFKKRLGHASKHSLTLVWSRFLLFAMPFLIYIVLTALIRPYGEWDAWSYWNFRANFIMHSGGRWEEIFHYNLQGFHPLLLPLIIVWGWSISGQETTLIPMLVSIVFTISTAGLLMGALRSYMSARLAILAGIFLCSIPYFLYHGTSQYADILTAYFLLASGVLGIKLFEKVSWSNSILCGICLGLLAFSKDNGIVAAVLLFLTLGVALLKEEKNKLNFNYTAIGFFIIGISVVIVKYLSSFNKINHAYDIVFSQIFQIQRWSIIINYLYATFFIPYWGGFWIVVLLAFGLGWRKLKQAEAGFIFHFIWIYFSLYLIIFCISVLQLDWLLSVSLDRFLYLLMPLLIFNVFYAFKPSRNS